jgi:AraC-like DNA-binding protein
VRTQLITNELGLVESLEISGPPTARPRRESYSAEFQICLPYHGAFTWHVGRDDVAADANQVLFVAGGEGYRLSQPVAGGYAELIVTVQPPLLAQLLDVPERHLPHHSFFRRRSRLADVAVQQQGAECLHRSARASWTDLEREEWLLHFVRSSLAPAAEPGAVSPPTARLLRRAKEYMAANLAAPLRLAHVARAVGSSPSYLTTVFRQREGLPLHQYLMRLRLARSLVELPRTDDITRLACDLGFADHSHFTAAFRRAFGATPSRFRDSMRGEPIRSGGAVPRRLGLPDAAGLAR